MKRFAGLKDLFNERFPGRRGTKLQDDDQTVTLQVGKTVWDQAPRQMRVELWMSSLQRKGVGMAAAAKYEDMLLTPVNEEAANDIEKDIARTFPSTKRFAAAEGQEALRRVLHAYAAYDPEVGYCQGMNFVAGLLLMYLPERHAFGGLVVLMQDRGLRKYYSTDMSLLQTHLWQLGRLMPQRLCAHLESHGVLPLLYAASWLMTCFSADFPASFSARVMDVILHGWMMDQALLKAAVAVLVRCEHKLLQMTDMEGCLQLLKIEAPAWEEAMLHDVLTDAFSKPWTTQQLMLLNSTEGAESVSEALSRVQQANTAAAANSAEQTPPMLPITSTAGSSRSVCQMCTSQSSHTHSTAVEGQTSGSSDADWVIVPSASTVAAATTQGDGSDCTHSMDSIPVLAAPAGVRVSVGDASMSNGTTAAAAVAVHQLGPPAPSPKRPLASCTSINSSSRPTSTASSDGGAQQVATANLLLLDNTVPTHIEAAAVPPASLGVSAAASSSESSSSRALCVQTGMSVSPVQVIEQGSCLIDLSSPRSNSADYASQARTAEQQQRQQDGQQRNAVDWDPFGAGGGVDSRPTLICQSAATAAAPREIDGSNIAHGAAQTQLQQPHQQQITVQDLRQHLEELSFSQLSQQQHKQLQQQGARLDLLEQLNRQQLVLQRHYSLPRSNNAEQPVSPIGQQGQQQQQQQARQQQQQQLSRPNGLGDLALDRLKSEDWSDFQSSPSVPRRQQPQ